MVITRVLKPLPRPLAVSLPPEARYNLSQFLKQVPGLYILTYSLTQVLSTPHQVLTSVLRSSARHIASTHLMHRA
jgi:hypothetical protein